MCRGIVFVSALVAICSVAPRAQATFLADFEAPAFTAGAVVDGQVGWIAAGRNGYADPKVVAVPTGSPAVLGGQWTEIGNYYTDHSLAGAGFTDLTDLSLITGYTPGNGDLRLAFYGPGTGGADKLAEFHIYGNNVIADRTPNISTDRTIINLASSDAKLWKLDLNLDFIAQKYNGVCTDMSTSTSYETGWTPFLAACTKAQAESHFYFSSDRSTSSTGPQYLDNLSVGPGQAPEPSAIVLVSTALFGLLAYAWRRRK
jgi:hypothetical protein